MNTNKNLETELEEYNKKYERESINDLIKQTDNLLKYKVTTSVGAQMIWESHNIYDNEGVILSRDQRGIQEIISFLQGFIFYKTRYHLVP